MKLALILLVASAIFPSTPEHTPVSEWREVSQTTLLTEVPEEPAGLAESEPGELFDFPISRAIGLDVDEMLRPEPKIYHFGWGPLIR